MSKAGCRTVSEKRTSANVLQGLWLRSITFACLEPAQESDRMEQDRIEFVAYTTYAQNENYAHLTDTLEVLLGIELNN